MVCSLQCILKLPVLWAVLSSSVLSYSREFISHLAKAFSIIALKFRLEISLQENELSSQVETFNTKETSSRDAVLKAKFNADKGYDRRVGNLSKMFQWWIAPKSMAILQLIQ